MATGNYNPNMKYPLYVINDIDDGSDWLIYDIQDELKVINKGFYYHKIYLLDGYYAGVQLFVEEEGEGDEEEVKAESILVEKELKRIADSYGFKKIKVAGRFSNGETIYEVEEK